MPKYPQHPNCQCRLQKVDKPIPNVTAKAVCSIDKFTGYVFDNGKNNGKKAIFEGFGYSNEHSKYLMNLYVEQAIQKYCNGQYKFNGVRFYARIEIVIDLETPNKGLVHIKSGWALMPNGEIRLSTPFSGFVK